MTTPKAGAAEKRESNPEITVFEGNQLTPDEVKYIEEYTRTYFKSDADPRQGDPTSADFMKLVSADPKTLLTAKEGDKIVGWSYVVPTTSADMTEFVGKRMDEKTLFANALANIDKQQKELQFTTDPQGKMSFDALYLMTVLVLPEIKGATFGPKLMGTQVDHFKDTYGVTKFFAWTWDKGRTGLAELMAKRKKVDMVFRVEAEG